MDFVEVRFLWSAAAAAWSHVSPFDNPLELRSHQGLVMVDLLDNFQDFIKLFLAVASNFMKSLWGRMGEGKEKKNDESSTAKQVKDRWKRLKQKLSQIKSPIKHILSKKLPAQC
jgi:hypothetical protein